MHWLRHQVFAAGLVLTTVSALAAAELPATKAEPKLDSKTTAKLDSPVESTVESQAESKPEAKAESKSDASWMARLFAKTGKKAPDPETAKPSTPLRPSVITAPLSQELLSEAVKAEEAACMRRLDVCAKLREAAIAANDESLLRQIDELERQAIELCHGRITRLGLRGTRTVARSAQPTAAGVAK